MVKHNGVLYRAADAHAHIYPGKIAEKATENVGRFYDLPMAEVGLPHVLNEEGTAVGFDKFLVCSVATKVEQVGSINRFIAAKCEKYPKFVGLGKACLKGANVWVDTSSSLFVLNPDEARRSIEHFGMDKVMFGTDFPMWTHKKELERFFALGYGEEENRKMLYDNFEKLFKL